jgi:hypothetical protein
MEGLIADACPSCDSRSAKYCRRTGVGVRNKFGSQALHSRGRDLPDQVLAGRLVPAVNGVGAGGLWFSTCSLFPSCRRPPMPTVFIEPACLPSPIPAVRRDSQCRYEPRSLGRISTGPSLRLQSQRLVGPQGAGQGANLRRNLISPGDVSFAALSNGNPHDETMFVLTIATVLAGAGPASAQQQPPPAPSDQGNGNWDPPPVTKPTTQR